MEVRLDITKEDVADLKDIYKNTLLLENKGTALNSCKIYIYNQLRESIFKQFEQNVNSLLSEVI